jgi:hypothetical protein
MDHTNASAFAPSGALARAVVRSTFLVATAGAFFAISTATASAADNPPTSAPVSQSGQSTGSESTTSDSDQTAAQGQEPASSEHQARAPADNPEPGDWARWLDDLYR